MLGVLAACSAVPAACFEESLQCVFKDFLGTFLGVLAACFRVSHSVFGSPRSVFRRSRQHVSVDSRNMFCGYPQQGSGVGSQGEIHQTLSVVAT